MPILFFILLSVVGIILMNLGWFVGYEMFPQRRCWINIGLGIANSILVPTFIGFVVSYTTAETEYTEFEAPIIEFCDAQFTGYLDGTDIKIVNLNAETGRYWEGSKIKIKLPKKGYYGWCSFLTMVNEPSPMFEKVEDSINETDIANLKD